MIMDKFFYIIDELEAQARLATPAVPGEFRCSKAQLDLH